MTWYVVMACCVICVALAVVGACGGCTMDEVIRVGEVEGKVVRVDRGDVHGVVVVVGGVQVVLVE